MAKSTCIIFDADIANSRNECKSRGTGLGRKDIHMGSVDHGKINSLSNPESGMAQSVN